MSIFGPANTVTAADIALLEESLQFFQSSPTNQQSVADAIQAGNTTVAAYAASLLTANLSFSQVAMGVSCIELGVAQTTGELDFWSTGFLPGQVQNAINNGFNPTVYAAEALGLALAGEPEFAAFTALDATQFSQQVSVLTGVSQAVIQTWVTNWTHFYTPVAQGGLGGSTFGLSITAAAYGAALGDAVGVALLNPTSADLQTVISTNAQGETVIQGDVANHLLDIATGQYAPGTDCDLLPQHTPLQGEAGSSAGGLRLTINVDNLTATTQDAIFDASPGPNPPLGTANTLNTGDNLQDPFGDGTLNYTTASGLFGLLTNPPFALGVTMNGIATANILNLDLFGIEAGFAGNIVGLDTVTVVAGSIGDVGVGIAGDGLDSPLQTVNINASVDFEAWLESSAFAGGEALSLNLGGVDTFVDLDQTGPGANFYAQVDINSDVDSNDLGLFTNADTIATVTVAGGENLTMHSNSFHDVIFGDFFDFESVLDVANLDLFDASAAAGDITVGQKCDPNGGAPEMGFFGTGDIQVLGGSGNDFFVFHTDGAVDVQGNGGDDQFTFQTDFGDATTFTAADSADGGAGNNQLNLEAYTGALLATGVGANIVDIQTIEHYTGVAFGFSAGMAGNLTVDMSRAGSATTLDLAGDYFGGDDVTVSNLTGAQTVIYSGINLDVLTLEPVNPLATVNFTMAQDLANTCLDTVFGVVPDHILNELDVASILLNLVSTGNADTNVIANADFIDANITIAGDVDLDIGVDGGAYDFVGGTVLASTFTGDLDIEITGEDQTIITGLGDDRVEVRDSIDGGPTALINLSAGGSDRVEFEDSFTANDAPVDNSNYHLITGFDVVPDANGDQDAVDIDLDATDNDYSTTTGIPVAPGDPLITFLFTTNTKVDADAGTDFNFIKVDTPVSLSAGDTGEDGFDIAMGMDGKIDTDAGTDDVLFAYYDATGGQMVLGRVDDAGTEITQADDFDIVALIAMSKAEFDAFGVDNLNFVV